MCHLCAHVFVSITSLYEYLLLGTGPLDSPPIEYVHKFALRMCIIVHIYARTNVSMHTSSICVLTQYTRAKEGGRMFLALHARKC
jgi:hypothetical protein